MTRKDYVALARALAEVRPNYDRPEQRREQRQWEDCCRVVGDVLAADNPNFDRIRFTQALLAGS